MVARLKHEDVAKHYLDGGIKLLSQYVNNATKNSLECLDCGHKWSAKYSNYSSQGRCCPKCAGVARHNHDDVAAHYLEGGIKLLSQYVNNKTKNNIECLVCNHRWQARYDLYSYQGNGCPKCAGVARHNHEDVAKHYLEGGIKLLSRYTNNMAKNDLECLVCSHRWKTRYHSHLSKCPNCHSQKHYAKTYKGEIAYVRIYSRLKQLLTHQYNHTTFDDFYTDEMIRSLSDPIKYIYAECKQGNSIDHIIPISWFDCTDYTQMKYAWSEYNLRYLPYSENVSRQNKVTPQEMRQLLLDFPLVWLIALEAKYTPNNIRQVIFESISKRSVRTGYDRLNVA